MHDVHEVMKARVSIAPALGSRPRLALRPLVRSSIAPPPLSHISAFPHLVRGGGREEQEETHDANVDMDPIGSVWSIVRDVAVADPEGFQ